MSTSLAPVRPRRRADDQYDEISSKVSKKVAQVRLPKLSTLIRRDNEAGARPYLRRSVYANVPEMWASKVCGFIPDPWQAELLGSTSPTILVNCCRQSGKSTTVASLTAHLATFKPGSLAVTLAPAQRQAAELLRTSRHFYRQGGGGPLRRDNVFDYETADGARVISLPSDEDNIRGLASVDLLVLDEAARIPDDLYFAVIPFITVSRGRRIAMSTPKGQRGWWYRAWIGEDDEPWERYTITAKECPRLDPVMIARLRRSMGNRRFNQEYYCTFEETAGALLDPDDIAATKRKEVEVWDL